MSALACERREHAQAPRAHGAPVVLGTVQDQKFRSSKGIRIDLGKKASPEALELIAVPKTDRTPAMVVLRHVRTHPYESQDLKLLPTDTPAQEMVEMLLAELMPRLHSTALTSTSSPQ